MLEAGIFWLGRFNWQKQVVGMDFFVVFFGGDRTTCAFLVDGEGRDKWLKRQEKVLMISTCTLFHGE